MSDTVKRLKKEYDKKRRDTLAELLAQCTEEQQTFFHRLYPGGVKKMPGSKIDNAIDQVERTIVKNNQPK